MIVNPTLLSGDSDVFVSGNNAESRQQVMTFLKEWFGWKAPIDLGDITSARGVEALLLLTLPLMGAFGTSPFGYKIVR